MTRLAWLLALAPAAVLAPAVAEAADDASIRGIVTDAKTRKPLEGAIVVIECVCLQQSIERMTNATGGYAADGLPAGPYRVTVARGKARLEKEFTVQRSAKQRANFSLDPDDGIHRKIIVRPMVESSKTESGRKIDAQEWGRRIPTDGKRDFTGAAESAPTAQQTPGGLTLGGGTATDIKYTLGDTSLSSPRSGRLASGILLDFLSEIDVLEAGYDAEYGDASTGQVRTRRISGNNKLRGSARFTYTPRLAAPRTIFSTDNAVRALEVPDYQMQSAIQMSGPIIKDKLWFTGGVSLTGGRSSLIQSFHRRIDKDNSGGYEECPYENGAYDCVDGGDYIATEKFAEQKFKTGFAAPQFVGGLDWAINKNHRLGFTIFSQPTFQRRAYRRAPNANYDPSAFGNTLSSDPLGGGSLVANGIVNDSFGWDRGNSTTASLDYTGRVAKDRIEIDGSLGYGEFVGITAWKVEDPEGRTTPLTQQTDNQGASLFTLLDRENKLDKVAGVEQACNDSNLPGQTCPVRQWLSGGIGPYGSGRQRRIEGMLSLTHFFNAAGAHQLKYGGRAEHVEDRVVDRYSGNNAEDFYDNCAAGMKGGGEWCYDPSTDEYDINNAGRVDNHRLIRVDTDNPNNRTSIGYGRIREEQGELRAIATPIGGGARVDAYRAKVATQNYSFYLQDRWAIKSNLFLSAGMRWEIQDMRDVLGRRAVFIWDNVAPRVGMTYDWTDEGKSRLYASYGWFYQPLPLQLNSRVFGGLVQVGRTYRNSDCVGQTTSTSDGGVHQRMIDGSPTEYCADTGSYTTGLTEGAVVPRLRGQYNQQFQMGYEQEVIEDLTLGVRWLHNDLGRAVEDISTDGGNNFIIANPGVAVSQADIASQNSHCADLERDFQSTPDDAPNRPELARELHRCEFLAEAYSKVGTDFTRPRRTYDAFTFEANKRFGRSWMFVGSYTYSRLVGNTDGFIDPITGNINLGASSQYDLPELVRNSFGPLSQNIPHRVRVDGYYMFDLKEAGQLTLGSSFRYQSGYPISLRGSNSRYGFGSVYVVPRGAGGRVEGNYSWNLSLAYGYPIRVGKNDEQTDLELEVALRWFNVTNAKTALRVDEIYSFDTTRAVAGADLGDIKHVKIQSAGRPSEFFQREVVAPQGNYGVRTAFQNPTAMQLDVVLRF